MARLRLVVLVSGRGSNLDSLLAAAKVGTMRADVVRVVSNKPDAAALDVASRAGIETRIVHSAEIDRAEHDARMMRAIDEARPDLVLLAGYMRILGAPFIAHYRGRLINIHPSLLPAFPGLDAQGQAHRAGVRIAGCTTHFVTEEVDAGPILAQAALAVDSSWSVDELRSRILALEHELYPMSVELIASGRARFADGRVTLSGSGAILEERS